jgi:hypothetical protein
MIGIPGGLIVVEYRRRSWSPLQRFRNQRRSERSVDIGPQDMAVHVPVHVFIRDVIVPQLPVGHAVFEKHNLQFQVVVAGIS